MKRFLYYYFIIVAFVVLATTLTSCNKGEDPNSPIPSEQSPQAKAYLTELMDIMEKNSINRYKIDWVTFRSSVINKVPTAQTVADTYLGVMAALSFLSDNHSSFTTPAGYKFMGSTPTAIQIENIEPPTIPDDVGYVRVTDYAGQTNDASAIVFASQIQNQIKQQDHSALKGWIVDLRNNLGGNMWPMLAGIGPILGEGIAGYFIDPDGNETSWGVENGASVMNGYPLTQLSNSYELLAPNPKVAVLLNSAVASSGEIIAVSFIGRENTKSFGSATRGLSTANSGFMLSDYAILNLTVSYQADRNKKKYGVPINPDMLSRKETIINDALAWIKN